VAAGTLIGAGLGIGFGEYSTSYYHVNAEQDLRRLPACMDGHRRIERIEEGTLECAGVRIYEVEEDDVVDGGAVKIDWKKTEQAIRDRIAETEDIESRLYNDAMGAVAGGLFGGVMAYFWASKDKQKNH